jgi:hypothetical protein
MDFGINSRSIIYSRKKARLQGYYLFLRSYFSKNNGIFEGKKKEIYKYYFSK